MPLSRERSLTTVVNSQPVSLSVVSGNGHDKCHPYGTGQGATLHISEAYSAIVRSLENFPEFATLRIAFRVHAS